MRLCRQVGPGGFQQIFRPVPVQVSCILAIEKDGLDNFALVDDAEEDLVNVLPVIESVIISPMAGAWCLEVLEKRLRTI